MGCTAHKGSQKTRQSKSSSSPYLICSTEAKIQIFIQTLSQTSTRDNKSAQSYSLLFTQSTSKSIKKSVDIEKRQNKQIIVLDPKQTKISEVDQMPMGQTPQLGKKNIKATSNQIKQLSQLSIDHVMESYQSTQFINGVTKQRIINCISSNKEKGKQDT